jgi:peptidoglycan hydrolase CwlO-like protein
MAGLPASPPFVNPAANALAEFNTPAILAVPLNTVHAEASWNRRLHQAVDDGLTSGGIPVVTAAEAGMADVRHESAIAQSFIEAMAPPWFAGALAAGLAPIQAQIAPMACQIADMQAQIADMQPQIADMQAQIADMQAQIAPIPGQLASLQAQVDNVTVTRNNVQASKEGDLVQFE